MPICFQCPSHNSVIAENKFIKIMKNKNAIVIAALDKYVYNSMIKCRTANPSEHSKKEKAKKENKAE